MATPVVAVPAAAGPDEGLAPRLISFVAALREHGLQVGTGETVDAGAALAALGLADRDQLRHGLAATLLRRDGHREVFDAVFDIYFPAAVGETESMRQARAAAEALADPTADGAPPLDEAAALRAELLAALAADDRAELTRLAAAAVSSLGWIGDRPGTGTGPRSWSAMLALQSLSPQTLVAQLDQLLAEGDPNGFTARLSREEARRRVEAFKAMVETEARRRAAEVRERSMVSRYAAKAADMTDFTSASAQQLAELRRTVQPLSRRLASRLSARRRRHKRGEIDLRRTFRSALSTGGVPMRPVMRRHRPGKPEIVLLCDVSGSVAGFANFTLMLVEALHDQFSRVRAFAFVDTVDEVTHIVAENDADPATLVRRIAAEATVSGWYGHSDYGNALRGFANRFLDAVGPRTSVLILGDGRNNGGDPNLPDLARIVDKARHVHWLNPEPAASWGTGDSEVPAYKQLVEMHECRNAQQLASVISRLLPV